MIIRETTPIYGYVGIYNNEPSAKPSFHTKIYKKSFFRKKLIYEYFMVHHIYRDLGVLEAKFGFPSTLEEYGKIWKQNYKYMKEIKPKSLKRIDGFFN